MIISNIILMLIFAPILFGTIYYLHKINNRFILLLLQSLFIGAAIYIFSEVLHTGHPINFVVGNWELHKGINLEVSLLTGTMLVITTFMFLMYFIYEFENLNHNALLVLLLLILQGLMLALLLSNDFFNIFVLLEVCTILVSILIIYKKEPSAYYDSLIYLLSNIVGMSFYLLGLGFLYKMYGTFNLTVLSEQITMYEMNGSTIIPYALILTGIIFKTGLVPVFTLLPKADSSVGAPPVVSAVLAGIYINLSFTFFIKIQNIWHSMLDTNQLFTILALATIVIGSIIAFTQTDIMKLLAFSTVSQIGLIMYGITLNSYSAYKGVLYHIASHSIFKSLLFLIAGVLIKEYGTRNLNKMHSLFDRNKGLAYSLLIAILSISGFPLLNGSIGKSIITHSMHSLEIDLIMYGISFLTLLYSSRLLFILFGKSHLEKITIPKSKSIVFYTLTLICILTGVFAPFLAETVLNQHLELSFIYLLKKAAILFTMLLFILNMYKKILHNHRFVNFIGEIHLNFNVLISMIFSLFMIILSYSLYLVN
ncbi:MAG: proton-conducting transporter membrane subunit [Clostridia bacterium]|jgi:multicomponent Na+:H+ antiporter subunit D|nr:proton-conducting transporter membrane subunit [Clostridia bacterium]